MAEIFKDDRWQQVTGKDAKAFFDKVSPIDGRHQPSETSTAVAWRALPFYKGVALIKVSDAKWQQEAGDLYFLGFNGNFYRLNGMSTPIHEINHLSKIRVSEENVLEYLRFFCYFVHGDKGPFLIVEQPSAIDLPANMRKELKDLIDETVVPATFNGMTDDGKFDCSGMVYYGRSLFTAQFHVYPNGLIEMVDDEQIIEDLNG